GRSSILRCAPGLTMWGILSACSAGSWAFRRRSTAAGCVPRRAAGKICPTGGKALPFRRENRYNKDNSSRKPWIFGQKVGKQRGGDFVYWTCGQIKQNARAALAGRFWVS